MKPLVVALVALIIWNGLLSGVVLYQRQALLNDEANIGVLNQNQIATHDQLEKVTTALNRTTRAQNKTAGRESNLEDAVLMLLKALKAAAEDQGTSPSSLKLNRSNYENVQ